MPYAVKIDEDKCTGDGECVSICPMLVFEFDKEKKKVKVVRGEECQGCMSCVAVCPNNAITVTEI